MDGKKRCPICYESIDNLAGNPADWGIKIPRFLKNEGKTVEIDFHIRCINKAIDEFRKPNV